MEQENDAVEVEEEETEEIFQIVENPATFPGGIGAFYSYVQKNLKYPSQAQRMGMESRCTLQRTLNMIR